MNLFNRIKFASAVFDNNPEAQKLLKSGQLKIASDIKQPAKRKDVIDMEAINAFMKRNPVEKADGGRIPLSAGNPTKKELQIAEKVHGNKPEYKGKKGIELWRSLKQFERSNIVEGHTTGGYGGVPGGKLKKNMLSKDGFIKLLKENKGKTYNEFLEILKSYKTKDGKKFTKQIIADRMNSYNLLGTLEREEPKGRSEESKANRREAQKARYYDMMSTEEGRAKLKETRVRSKAKEYQLKGMDPPATKAEEALWKDIVKTAKENPGEGRFSIASGYEKSMNSKNFYSGKIKIKDNKTNKTFTFNTFKNYINRNAASFNLKNFNEVIKPYKQKFFINDLGLRNIINEVLIPGYNTGMSSNAFTIQHDFGRHNNPLKVSLAFYDDNVKEFKIRTDFEKAWAKASNTSKPLKNKKEAFNVFKKDLEKLNIQSSPSMVKRDRFFGKELDLKSAVKKAKELGATIPKGTFKKITELDKQLIEAIGCDPKASGGRVGYESGTACFKKGIDAINNNKIKTPSQAKNFEKLLKVGRNITKYGIIPEALFLTGESLIRLGLGDNPKEALLRASQYLLPGDQEKIADRSMYTRLLNENSANIIERVNNYKKELNKLDSLKSQKDNASNLTTTGEFDYFTQTQKDVDKYYNPLIKKQEDLVEKFKRPETEEVYAKRMKDEATDIRTSNSLLTKAKKLSKDMARDDDIYNIEQLKAPEKIIDTDMFPNFREFMKKPEVRDDINLMNVKDEDLINFAIENNQDPEIYLQYKKALQSGYDINNLASDNMFGAEQLYGAQGHAGVPIELDMSKLEGPTSSRYEGFSPSFNTYKPMAGGGIARIPLSDGTDINKEKINLDEIVKNIVGVREPSDGVPGGVLGAAAGMKDKQQLAQRRGTEVIKQNKTSFVKSFLWAFENAEKEEKENIIKQWETKMGNVSINLTNMATGVETKGAEYLSNKIGLENSLPTRIDENSVVEVIASLDLPQDFQAKMSAAQNLAGDDILDLTIKNNIFGISFNEEEGSGSTIEASGMLKFDEQGLKFKPAITKDDKNFITKSLDVVKTVGDEGVIGLNIAQGEENNLNKVGISFGSPINTKNLDFGNISLQTTTETSDNKDKTDSGITYTFPDGSTTIGATFERDNTKGEDVKKYEFEKYLNNSKLFANRKEGDKGTNLNYGVEFNDGILDGLTIDKQNFLKYGKKFDLNTYDPEDQFNIKKNRGIIEIGGSLNNELEPNFNIMFTKKFDGNYNKRNKPYNYSYSGNELDEIYEEYQKTDGFTKEPVDEKMLPPRMFADGGIAGLTKTIAPESGPKPQGLPYVYNNVKKI